MPRPIADLLLFTRMKQGNSTHDQRLTQMFFIVLVAMFLLPKKQCLGCAWILSSAEMAYHVYTNYPLSNKRRAGRHEKVQGSFISHYFWYIIEVKVKRTRPLKAWTFTNLVRRLFPNISRFLVYILLRMEVQTSPKAGTAKQNANCKPYTVFGILYWIPSK